MSSKDINQMFEVVRGKSSIAAQMEAAMATNSASFDNNFGSMPPIATNAKARAKAGRITKRDRAAELLPRLRQGGYLAGISEEELLMMSLREEAKEAKKLKESDGAGIMDIIDPHGFMNGKYLMMRLAEVAGEEDGDDDDEDEDEDDDDDYEECDDDEDGDEEDDDGHGDIPPVSPALAFLRKEGKTINGEPVTTGPPLNITVPRTSSGHRHYAEDGDGEFPILRTPSSLSWHTFKEFGQPNTAPWPEEEERAADDGATKKKSIAGKGWAQPQPVHEGSGAAKEEMIEKNSIRKKMAMEEELYEDEDEDEETIRTEIMPLAARPEIQPLAARPQIQPLAARSEIQPLGARPLDEIAMVETCNEGREASTPPRRAFRAVRSRGNISVNPKFGLSRAISTLRKRKGEAGGGKKTASAEEENEALLGSKNNPSSPARERSVHNLRRRVRMLGKSRRSGKNAGTTAAGDKWGASKDAARPLDKIQEEEEVQPPPAPLRRPSGGENVVDRNKEGRAPEQAPEQTPERAATPSTPAKKLSRDDEDQLLAPIVVTPIKVRLNDATNEKQDKAGGHRLTDTADTPSTAASSCDLSPSPRVRITVCSNANNGGYGGGVALPPAMPPAMPPAAPASGGVVVCRTVEEHVDPAALVSSSSPPIESKGSVDPPGAYEGEHGVPPTPADIPRNVSTMLSHEGQENPAVAVPDPASRPPSRGSEEKHAEDDENDDGEDDRDIFQIKNSYKLRSALYERQTAIAAILAAKKKKKEDQVRAVLLKADFVMEETPDADEMRPIVGEESRAVEEEVPIVEEKAPLVEEEAPAAEEKPPMVETNAPVAEKKQRVLDERVTVVEEKRAVDADTASASTDDNEQDDDDEDPLVRVVYNDSTHGVISASTDVFVEVSSPTGGEACEDIEVIHCMGLGEPNYESIDDDNNHRIDEEEEVEELDPPEPRTKAVKDEEEEEAEERDPPKRRTKIIEESAKIEEPEEVHHMTVYSDRQTRQENETTATPPSEKISKPPLVKKRTSRGRLGPSKIRGMMNRSSNNNERERSKSRERTQGHGKSVERRSKKKIGVSFRKKKQTAGGDDADRDGAIGGKKSGENTNEAATSASPAAGGSGVSVRGLSSEARKALLKNEKKVAKDGDNAAGNSSVRTSRTDKGLSSEARKALKKARKGHSKSSAKDSPTTRKESEMFVPIVITPVISPRMRDRKGYHGLSREAQATLDGKEDDLGLGEKRRGHHGLSKKAKGVLARDDDAVGNFEDALEEIEVSVGLHLDKNSMEEEEDEILAPGEWGTRNCNARRLRSRSSSESGFTSASEEEDVTVMSERRPARSRRSRRKRRGRRSRSVESDYTSGSEEDSRCENDDESTYHRKRGKGDSDDSYANDDDSYSSRGSSASKSVYSESSQSDGDESDDESSGDRLKPFGIPHDEIVEDLKDAFDDTAAHVSAQMEMIRSSSPLIKSFDTFAGVVRGRSMRMEDERSDCARRGGTSPSRKRADRSNEVQFRPPRHPRPPRSGSRHCEEQKGGGKEAQGRPPRPDKSKKKKSKGGTGNERRSPETKGSEESAGHRRSKDKKLKGKKSIAEGTKKAQPSSFSCSSNEENKSNNIKEGKEKKIKKTKSKKKKSKGVKCKEIKETLSEEPDGENKETKSKKKKNKEKKNKAKKSKKKKKSTSQ